MLVLKVKREVLLGVEHFFQSRKEIDDADEPGNDIELTVADVVEPEAENALFKHMYGMVTSAKKTLIFANSRNETEEIIHKLRQLAGVETADEDGFYVHHGSIAASLREQAEDDMRDPDRETCISATMTLELGIDIGNLDQVLQLNATSTVSSFVQRLGRSGRRGGPAKMFFYCREPEIEAETSLGESIPWTFLQMIAVMQLYFESKWIEPPEIPKLPLNVLYQQTMSIVTATTEITPPELAERVLTLSPFQNVSQDQFRTLLRHLISTEHLETLDSGGLIIGSAAEKVINHYRFYATFEDATAYMVRDGTREIGTIESAPELGARFTLAGRSWQTLEVNEDRRTVLVQRVRGKSRNSWTGGKGGIHTRVVERMRQVLLEDTVYSYLHPSAIARLTQARRTARENNVATKHIIAVGGQRYMLLPWKGSRIAYTLERLLACARVSIQGGVQPFFLEVNAASEAMLSSQLRAVSEQLPTSEQLIHGLRPTELARNKFERFVPDALLREAYLIDQLDLSGSVEAIQELLA